MAKQKGYIKIKGSLGGLTFYDAKGEGIIRTTGGVDKEKVLTDPAFKRTRENMAEFGGSATVGKSFRMGFGNVIKSMGDSTITARVTGLMKRINSAGPGIRGKRSFEILNNKHLIKGFEFNKSGPLASIFSAPFAPLVYSAERNLVTWVVPDFNTENYLNAPDGATHFRLVLSVGVLSDFEYQNTSKGFEPVNPAENGIGVLAVGNEIALEGMAGSDTTLVADLGAGMVLPNTVGVMAAIGIIFYQEINTQLYELASDNAMRIEEVG